MTNKAEKPVVIGLCVAAVQDETNSEIVGHICSFAAAKGYRVAVFNSFTDLYLDDSNTQGAKSVFYQPRFDQLTALVIMTETFKRPEFAAELASRVKAAGIPVIAVDTPIEGCHNLKYDYTGAFEKIVRHVCEVHKCRRINMIAGMRNNDFSDARIAVFRRVLAEYDIPLEEDQIGYGDFWGDPARRCTDEFLDSGKPVPEAIICANDVMAMAVCSRLSERGIRCPEDIIVTGFDGIDQEKYHTPRLTTALQDNKKMGEEVISIVSDYVEKGYCDRMEVNVKHAVRFSQSCRCLPLQYRDVNPIVMKVYEKCKQINRFTNEMNMITARMTNCDTVEEALACTRDHLGAMYISSMLIMLRKPVLEADEEFDLRKPVEKGEALTLLASRDVNTFEVLDDSFKFGDTPEFIYDMFRVQNNLLFYALHYQNKIFGMVCISFDPAWINYENVMGFSVSLNHAIDTIYNKGALLHLNNKLSESNRKLEDMYIHDSLTGLYNRMGFYRELKSMYAKWQKKKSYIFVSSIDLDGLKYINDNFGHQEGDFAIRSVGLAISDCVGENGICARFGGDEFMAVIFFEDRNDSFVSEFDMRLGSAVAHVNKSSGKNYEIGASCGIEISAVTETLNLDEIMKTADDRMYEKKSSRKHFRGRQRNN